MEDLEINPLYRAYLTTFRRRFDLVCEMSYLLVIPHSDTLENLKIDQTMIDLHILVPSKLLKMHYTPLQAGSVATDIELDGKKLIVNFEKRREHSHEKSTKTKVIINILAEEIGYNSRGKEYRTILIDRPLQFDNQKRQSRIGDKSRFSSKSNSNGISIKPKKPLKDQDDCSRFLESISQELTHNLESEIILMQSNYIILSKFLDDAADKIKFVCESYIPKYEIQLDQKIDGYDSNQIQQQQLNYSGASGQAVRISVENYVMSLLHGKIIACIHESHEKQDKKMLINYDAIQRSAPDVTALGAQPIFSDFHIPDDLAKEIRNLPNLRCPLAIVSSLTRSIELINGTLNQNVKFKLLMGIADDDQLATNYRSTQSLDNNDLVTICSDDLIASLVYCFANIKTPNLYSISKYLNIFGWTSTSKDQVAYNAATFHLVVQYIYSYESQTSNNSRSRQLSNSSSPTLRPKVSATPKRVQSVKSMDSLTHKRSASRLSLSTHFSLLDASTKTQDSSRDEPTNLDLESIHSSSTSSITKSGWIFLGDP